VSQPKFLYPSHVFWNEEDEGFIATAPDLPGCSAFGATQAEALAELEGAIEAWIGAAVAAGNPVPEPSPPRVEPQTSGKILLRLPKDLHATLLRNAEQQATSLNQYAVYLLTAAVTGQIVAQAVATATEAHRLSTMEAKHALSMAEFDTARGASTAEVDTTHAASTALARGMVGTFTFGEPIWRMTMGSAERLADSGHIVFATQDSSAGNVLEYQTGGASMRLPGRIPFSHKSRSRNG